MLKHKKDTAYNAMSVPAIMDPRIRSGFSADKKDAGRQACIPVILFLI